MKYSLTKEINDLIDELRGDSSRGAWLVKNLPELLKEQINKRTNEVTTDESDKPK